MSASVFKPVFKPLRFEMPRIRGVSNANRGLCTGMEKVRRALFEPADHVETEKFLQQELALYTRNECNKWEFDFSNGVPYNPNNNKGRFAWKPVTPKITQAPKKRFREEECYDNSELYPMLPDKVVRLDSAECMDDKTTSTLFELLPKRQSKITDFMQSRKRPADLAFTKKSSSLSSYSHLSKQPIEKS